MVKPPIPSRYQEPETNIFRIPSQCFLILPLLREQFELAFYGRRVDSGISLQSIKQNYTTSILGKSFRESINDIASLGLGTIQFNFRTGEYK